MKNDTYAIVMSADELCEADGLLQQIIWNVASNDGWATCPPGSNGRGWYDAAHMLAAKLEAARKTVPPISEDDEATDPKPS